MHAVAITMWLTIAGTPPHVSPAPVPAPRLDTSSLRVVPGAAWPCRTNDRAANRDARLRRTQIAFAIIWGLGTAAVIGGAIGVGVTASDCINQRGCKHTIASAAVLGVGIPVALTGLIGFSVTTGIRRSDNRNALHVGIGPGALRMRF
jgi:hypothetical protein